MSRIRRLSLLLIFLFLCEVVFAQTYRYQYAHDTVGNRVSRIYQGARSADEDASTSLGMTQSPAISTERSEWRDPDEKYSETDVSLIDGDASIAAKDTTKRDPSAKTPAEKEAYLKAMMDEAMRMQPLPDGGQRTIPQGPVGEIPLSYGVSGSGARTYSIPIYTAPDIKYAPSLSLVYNSQGGYGYAGYGWDFSGLSAITLTNKTLYWDGEIEAADSSDTDGVFCLDGVRLVTNNDAVTSASYPLVTATGHILVAPHRSLGGYITTFTALYPDGTTAIYGIPNIDNQFTFPVYPVTRTSNINGERIDYSYTFSGGWNNNACPVLSGIRYGFNANGVATAEISLSYSTPSCDAVSYVAGRSMSRKPVASNITSTSGSTTLYTYSLSYINPSAADASLLKTISITNSAGESLPSLNFTYGHDSNPPAGNGHLQLADSIQLIRGYVSNPVYRRGKFVKGTYDDGLVGYADLSSYIQTGYHRYDYHYATDSLITFVPSLTNPSSCFSISPPAGFLTSEAVDVNGDGVDEMVIVSCLSTDDDGSLIKISVWKYNPQSDNNFTVTSHEVRLKGRIYNGLHYSPCQRTFRWGDFRGDGTTQMLSVCYSENSFGYEQWYWSSLVDIESGVILDERVTQPVAYDQDRRIVCTDIDGDGRTELCIAASDRLYLYRFVNNELADADWINVIHADFIDTDRSFSADINADGYMDFIQASSYDDRWYFRFNTGIGFAPTITMHICTRQADDRYMFMDIDRDGYPDLVQLRGSDIVYYRNNNGTSFSYYSTSPTPIQEHSVILPPNVVEHSAMSSFVTIFGKYLRIYDYDAYVPPLRHLVQSCDSYGKTIRNTYQYLPRACGYWTDNPSGIDNTQGYQLRILPLYVLTGAKGFLSASDTSKVFLLDTYAWYDGVVHTRGLGFCGFSKTRRAWSLDGVSRAEVTRYDPQRRGIPVSTSVHPLSDSYPAFSQTTYTFDNHPIPSGQLQPRLTQTSSYNTVTGISSSAYYFSYDGFDFPLKTYTSTSGGGAVASDIVYTTYVHSNNPNKYVLGIVASQTTLSDRDGDPEFYPSMGSRTVFSYDNLFRPVSKSTYRIESQQELRRREAWGRQVRSPDGIRTLDTLPYTPHLASRDRWQYDTHGNVVREESAPAGSAVFIGTSYSYDASGRHLVSSTDALGHTTTYSGFDKYGNPAIITNYRNQQTHTYRDGWGRITRTVHPDGTVDSLARAWGGIGIFTETTISSGSPDVTVDYDAAGREVLRSTQRFNGQWQKVKTIYNQRGLATMVSLPYRGDTPSHWNQHQYDGYGRPTRIIEASGRQTKWTYSGTTVTERKDGVRTVRRSGPSGALLSVSDSLSAVTYLYRDDGQPSSTSVTGGAATYFSYDTLGRRLTITDPSAGTRTTAYTTNTNGSTVVSQTNAIGSVVTTSDSLERIISVARPDFSTTYTYDADGRLVSSVSTNGTSSRYTYDQYDRVVTAKDSVPDGKWLQKAYTYNNDGNISTIAYTSQGGYITTETYGYANGYNTSITLPDNTVVFSLTSENDLGQPTEATSGSVSRTYGYTDYGLPTFRKLNNGSLQQFTYNFDAATGNLTSRSRKNGNNTITESFTYDNLGRLTSAGGNAVTYDTKNNITSMGGVGTMSYNASTRPYNITDLYANSTSSLGTGPQTLTYTAYDRPATIAQNGYSATFTYNDAHERVKMLTAKPDGNHYHYYIGGRYELEYEDDMGMTTEILWLGGDAYTAPMMLVNTNHVGWFPRVIGRDYLGSITHIAYVNGTEIERSHYDAWGRGQNTYLASITLGRGWCGHEHLLDFGLINLNARLYDPALGRFLSPDPYVQAPDNPANFNRYSYCLNNPLKYTDPDGEIFFTTAMIIGISVAAVVGGVSGGLIGASHGATGWDMFGYIAGGALIGGLSALTGGAVAYGLAPALAAAGYGGFSAGFATGFFAGAAGGFVNGFGMGLLSTGSANRALDMAGHSMLIGGVCGGLIGGIVQGVSSRIAGKDFLTGEDITPKKSMAQPTNNLPNYARGKLGEIKAQSLIEEQGGSIIKEQVTIEVNGTKVKPDFVAEFDGQKVIVEVKTGSGGFTHNQAIAYPQMRDPLPIITEETNIPNFLSTQPISNTPIIPKGSNAISVWGNSNPVTNYQFIVIRINLPF